MSEEFPTLWKWLNENTRAVTAMAASIAAGATVIYTIVTAFLLGATRRQAKLTHQMIEASHTPYVSIRVEEPTDTSEQGMLAFNMVFENQGAVLAHIVKWEIGATLMGSKDKVHLKSPIQGLDSPSDTTLAPGQRRVIEPLFFEERLPNTELHFHLAAMLIYCGSGTSICITDFRATRTNIGWIDQESKMRRLEDMFQAVLGRVPW